MFCIIKYGLVGICFKSGNIVYVPAVGAVSLRGCIIYPARRDGMPQPVTERLMGDTNPQAKYTPVPSGSNFHGAKNNVFTCGTHVGLQT